MEKIKYIKAVTVGIYVIDLIGILLIAFMLRPSNLGSKTNEVRYAAGSISIDKYTKLYQETKLEDYYDGLEILIDGYGEENPTDNEDNSYAQYEKEEGSYGGVPEYVASEITLENRDTSVNYEISGKDIIYRGVTYDELYSVVNSVSQPYELNTFINFIIKTYDNKGEDLVFAELISSEGNSGAEEDLGASLTISEMLIGDKGYSELVEKYNEEASWAITLFTYGGENMWILYGCSSYILYEGKDELNVDMSEFDLGTWLDTGEIDNGGELEEDTIEENETTVEEAVVNEEDETLETDGDAFYDEEEPENNLEIPSETGEGQVELE